MQNVLDVHWCCDSFVQLSWGLLGIQSSDKKYLLFYVMTCIDCYIWYLNEEKATLWRVDWLSVLFKSHFPHIFLEVALTTCTWCMSLLSCNHMMSMHVHILSVCIYDFYNMCDNWIVRGYIYIYIYITISLDKTMNM